MPTLLQISIEANVCSVGKIEQQIGDMVLQRGWKSYMTYSRGYQPGASEAIKIGNMADVYWHVLMTRLFDRHGLHSKVATKKLIKTIQRINPDIIHLHQVHGYFLNLEKLFDFLKDFGKPIVWTFHDCWAFTGHCAHFVGADCDKWKTSCNNCPLKHDYPASYLDRSQKNFLLKRELFTTTPNLHIVTVSHWLEKLARQSFFKDCDIRTIYNGVDTEVFKPTPSTIKSELNLEGKKILLAAATTWNEQKGLKDYIKLSELLPEDIVIILVGINNAVRITWPSNIIVRPRTNSPTELAAYYSFADIVLNLSYAETFGLTTVEGLSCGTPGIVYNTTASPELLTKETGAVVEAGDIAGVFSSVKEILNNGKRSYSDNCRKRVLDYFEMHNQYAKYLELYKSILLKTEGNPLF